mgnify:CR=1 FL=1
MTEFPPAERLEAVERIRRNSHPLSPIPTAFTVSGSIPRSIRAALLDVYGTLCVSAAGEIGTPSEGTADRYIDAAAAVGWAIDPAVAAALAEGFHLEVKRRHAADRARGVSHPEVLVFDVWAHVLREHACPFARTPRTLRMFAVEVECRSNPVWPMPGVREALNRLHSRGVRLGIVSNAQPFTPLLFDALLGCSLEDLSFDPALCIWSWREGRAKPDAALLQRALGVLRERDGIAPRDVATIGNDRLNDLAPARLCGCQSWWFVGDRRSARLRADKPDCVGWEPDVVFQNWSAIR